MLFYRFLLQAFDDAGSELETAKESNIGEFPYEGMNRFSAFQIRLTRFIKCRNLWKGEWAKVVGKTAEYRDRSRRMHAPTWQCQEPLVA